MTEWVDKDRKAFSARRSQIDSALHGSTGMIDGVSESHKEKIFYEIVFCLCVPQSRAVLAQEAVKELQEAGLYERELTPLQIATRIKGKVRFQNTKALRIASARHKFPEIWRYLKRQYTIFQRTRNPEQVLKSTREGLVKFVDGMGMKLASQFLRNIGMRGLAILDVHVLDHLKERKLVKPFRALTKAQYYGIEETMKGYAKEVGISVDELDLLWWSNKTGFVLR